MIEMKSQMTQMVRESTAQLLQGVGATGRLRVTSEMRNFLGRSHTEDLPKLINLDLNLVMRTMPDLKPEIKKMLAHVFEGVAMGLEHGVANMAQD